FRSRPPYGGALALQKGSRCSKRQVAARKQRYLACAFQSSTSRPSTYGLGERIAVVGLAGFDQRSDDGVVLSAAVGACEERIFPRSMGLLSNSIRPNPPAA